MVRFHGSDRSRDLAKIRWKSMGFRGVSRGFPIQLSTLVNRQKSMENHHYRLNPWIIDGNSIITMDLLNPYKITN